MDLVFVVTHCTKLLLRLSQVLRTEQRVLSKNAYLYGIEEARSHLQ